MGGVDLNPASVRIVKADKAGRLSSETRYAPKVVWPGVATAEKGLWRTKLPGPVYLGSPVTDGSRVFVGTLDDDGLGTGAVVALDPASGKVAWTTKMPNSIKNQMVVCRGRVVCQDADGTVRALDCATGAEAWAVRAKGVWLRPFEHGIAADEATGTVFTEFEERFVAFDVATGAEKWRAKEFKLYGTAASCASLGDGIVTGEVQWHGLYACDPATGKKLWARDRKGPQGSKEQLRWRSGTVTISGGKVYATGGRNFYVLDAKTGETLAEHSYKITLGTTTKPLLLGGRIYLGSFDAGLVALDEKTLDKVWTGDVGETLVVSGSYKKAPQKQVATNPHVRFRRRRARGGRRRHNQGLGRRDGPRDAPHHDRRSVLQRSARRRRTDRSGGLRGLCPRLWRESLTKAQRQPRGAGLAKPLRNMVANTECSPSGAGCGIIRISCEERRTKRLYDDGKTL